MKTRTYRNGTFTCRSYIRSAGNGYEVGFVYGGRPIFVGNFIHSKEANQWYAFMNREIGGFTRKYKVAKNCPKSWYGNFLSTHLYNRYYQFLDRLFTKHTRTYRGAVTRNQRKYRTMSRRWTPGGRQAFLRAA